MNATIIITICVLLLIAYTFELSSSRTKIPAVILLLFLGWAVRQASVLMEFSIPDLSNLLPILGTLGLILIVLEGTLGLEFNRSKIAMIKISFIQAFLPMMALSFFFAFLFQYYSGVNFKDALLNAIPFSVISSSIAIPSSKEMLKGNREFVIYESSFSDIIGILFFNFLAFNTVINAAAFGNFGLEILVMAAISFIATMGLSVLLSRIDHEIKFVPIVIFVILIYEISKIYHLPALLFILLLGLFLGNLDELKRFKLIQRLKPDELNLEVHKFKDLITEATFLVRALFFLLFGFLMNTMEIINVSTFRWAIIIVVSIIVFRAIFMKLFRLPLFPLLFVAPRGLINILLFISIVPEKNIPFVNKSLIIQVIILSALLMMLGLIFSKNNKEISFKEDMDQLEDNNEVSPESA